MSEVSATPALPLWEFEQYRPRCRFCTSHSTHVASAKVDREKVPVWEYKSLIVINYVCDECLQMCRDITENATKIGERYPAY